MVLHPLASFALRPRRGIGFVVIAMLLLASLGCSQRRSSMRPVFGGPRFRTARPVLIPNNCPTGNCGDTVSGTVVSPGTTTIDTGAGSYESPSSLEPVSPALEAPTLPRIDESTSPASISPPRPNSVPDEPGLELNSPTETPPTATPGPSSSLTPNRRTSQAVPSTGSTVTPGTKRRSLFGRPREASLREKLRPFVNDPDDLFTPPKADRPWKYVVMHHSAHETGGLDEIDREHRKVLGWEGCGYHFVIGNGTGSLDGQVEVAQRWSNQKYGVHSRDAKSNEVNEYGVGICLVGDLDKSPPTPRQIEAAKALVEYLSDRYDIPENRIGTHAALAASPTACPGKNFPTQAIMGSRNYAQR